MMRIGVVAREVRGWWSAARGAKRSGAALLDALEPRSLFSAWTYQGQGDLFTGPTLPMGPSDGQAADTAVTLGDVNGDGVPDVAVGKVRSAPWSFGSPTSRTRILSGADQSTIRDIPWVGRLLAAPDFDGDGVMDLVIGGGLYSAATGALLVPPLITNNTMPNNEEAFERLVPVHGMTLANIAGDAYPELIIRDVRPDGLSGDRGVVRAFDLRTRALVWVATDGATDTTRSDFGRVVHALGDVNADGVPDILVGRTRGGEGSAGGQGSAYFILDGRDGAIIRRIDGISSGSASSAAVLGDIDQDGVPDFAATRGSALVADVAAFSGATGAILWTTASFALDVNAGAHLLAMPGLDGDSVTDLVFADTGRLQLITLSGVNGTRLRVFDAAPDLGIPDPQRHIKVTVTRVSFGGSMALGDIDGDGVLDVLVGSGELVVDTNLPGSRDREDRTVWVSGLRLAAPRVEGVSENLRYVWGWVMDRPFLAIDGVMRTVWGMRTFADFAKDDRILDVSSSGWVLARGAAADSVSYRAKFENFRWRRKEDVSVGAQGPVTVGVAISELGTVLAYREETPGSPRTYVFAEDASGGPAVWRAFPVFEAWARAISDNGRFVIGVGPGDTDTLLADLGAGPGVPVVTTIAGVLGADVNDSGLVVGTRPSGLRFEGVRVLGGVVTPLGSIGGQPVRPMVVNARGDIAGMYFPFGIGEQSLFSYRAATGELADAGVGTWSGAPGWSRTATDRYGVLGITRDGSLFGVRNDVTPFVIDPAGGEAMPEFAPGSNPVVGAWGPTGTIIAGIGSDGRLIILTRPAQNGAWAVTRIAPGTLGFSGRIVMAGNALITTDTSGNLLEFTRQGSGWTARNLSAEYGVGLVIQSLGFVATLGGLALLMGLDAAGDVVIVGQTTLPNASGRAAWTSYNLTDNVVRKVGGVTPDFQVIAVGDLVSWTNPWGGINIAGVWADRIVAFWVTPGRAWAFGTIYDPVLGGDAIFSQGALRNLAVTTTPWGGVTIVSGGSGLVTTWWAPGKERWTPTTLNKIVRPGAPFDVAGTALLGISAPWGGQTIIGFDRGRSIKSWWWAPGLAEPEYWIIGGVSEQAGLRTDLRLTGAMGAAVHAGGGSLRNEYYSIVTVNELGHIWLLDYGDPAGGWTSQNVSLSLV